ncbi:MAG: polysaccharide lyase family 8 super-sandwich domain-containing protein [Clostridium sp.]
MVRKKVNKFIIMALTTTIVSNLIMPTTSYGVEEKKNVNAVEKSIEKGQKVLLDESFSKEQVESEGEFKEWWENGIRPLGWQLRKWKGAAATEKNVPSGKVIKDESSNGGAYVDIKFNESVGFFQPDSYIDIQANKDYSVDVRLKKNEISSEPVTVRVEFYNEKKEVVERKDIIKLSGSGDWESINKEVSTVKANAKYMKVIFIFGNVSATSKGATGGIWIDNLKITCNEVKIDKVEFIENDIEIGLNKNYKPKVNILPKEATEGYSFKSEDESIAKIVNDSVYGVKEGKTTVVCIGEDGRELGKINVSVKKENMEEYNKALDSIFETMVPNSIIDTNDTQIMKIVKTTESNGNKHWKSMNKDVNRKGLWKDAESTTNSAHITTQFNRLYDMALAYTMKGSELKGDEELLKDIVDGLEWLKKNRYDGKKFYNNWWDFEIGSPQKLNGILILLRDRIDREKIIEYTDIIDKYVKDPTLHTQGKYPAVGGNRADMCKVVIYSGLLSGNNDRIKLGVKEMDILFEYVDDIIADNRPKVDGYYKDGSWVEHKNIPYAGTYGAILMGGVGEIVHVLDETKWSIPAEKVSVMYDVILQSFEPLIYKGVMMNMVSGRAISRDNELDYGHGFGAMRRILAFYTETAPKEYKDRFKSMIKEWIVSNDVRDILGKSTNLQFTVQAKKLMSDETIKPRGELIGNYVFANMDRAVHRRPGYVFGVSMYSDRIANYESLNGENLKGYHTSDGMTYLYNGDIEQYAKDFWPTVDSKRLPGTTVDTKNIFENVAGQNYGPGESATSNRSFTGGATLGDFGVVGMYLDNKRKDPKKDLGMDLEAKKSYFMFDNEIVALGAGITSTKDKGVETIVENRIIDSNKDKVYVNGEDKTKDILEEEVKLDAKSVYLEGDTLDKSIGYYFPNTSKINLKKETRTGSWKEINNGKSDAKKTNTFFTLWKDHEINPKNDTYEYVILPNSSKEDLNEYSEKSDIEIIDNNEKIQAVKEKNKDILGVNFWNENGGETSDKYISSNKKASVMLRKTNDEIELSVSDPTMKNDGSINIVIDEKLSLILQSDDRIKVEEKDGKISIVVNVSKSFGASIKLKLKVASETGEWKSGIAYKEKDIVRFNGKTYECIQSHNSIETWKPNVAHSLWKEKKEIQNDGSWEPEASYEKGDIVTYKGRKYECIQAHSSIVTWEPDVAHSLWKKQIK